MSSLIGTSKHDFENKLRLVPESVVHNVCRILHIEETNLAEFAIALDEIRYRQLLIMLSPTNLSDVTHMTCDCRIKYLETLWSIEISGSMHREVTLEIPITCPRERILVTCSSATGHGFPNSFVMRVNEVVVISNSPNLEVLDVSEMLGNSATARVAFECENEERHYNLSFIKCQKLEKRELIRHLLTRRLPCSVSPVPALCPITGEFMNIPVRSVKCLHRDCFDITELFKTTPLGKPLLCPVCHTEMAFNDLAVNYERMVENLRIRMKSAIPGMKEAGIRLNQMPEEIKSNFVDVGTQQVPDQTAIDVGTMTWSNEWLSDDW